MKKINLLLSFCTILIVSYGQDQQQTSDQKRKERAERINNLIKREEEGALIYSKQTAFGFLLNTDGWSVLYEHGKYKTITKTNLWWLQLGERKSQKEEKNSYGTDLGNGFVYVGSPFIYGKINNFYYLKAGVGQQYLIGGKGNKNGVAISGIYGGGISLGYLKPYYLTVTDSLGDIGNIKYTPSDQNTFLDPTAIQGTPGFTTGFFQGKFVPGIFGRLALRFDYGRYNELLSAIETGINADYYTQSMPIMALVPAKKFFLNAYIAIEFGSRK